MPVYKETVTYFTCKYKCGNKALPLAQMEDHEQNKCFCNPKLKACRVCKFYEPHSYHVQCNKLKLYMNNNDPSEVLSIGNDKIMWRDKMLEPVIKYNDSFDRPFPTTHCKHFKKGNKAY